jgi:colanic acid/amylovoran biosynthesis glycosyltransferase
VRIAYLINQYPKVSHSFIRREILALERLGFDITRIAIRGWGEEIVDDADLAERGKTRYVLQAGIPAIASAVFNAAVSRPAHLARAVALAAQMGWRAERPLPYHLIYLAEACLILRWLDASDAQHVHAHFGTNSAEVAMLVRALGGPPFSFTAHGPEEFDKAAFIGLAEKIRRAAFVIAVSSFGRSQLFRVVSHQHWGKIHVVHCGLEPAYFQTEPAARSGGVGIGSHEDGASNQETYPESRNLVCIGRLCEQKGQLLLIEAARRLAAAGTDFTLTLAGDGELRGEIEALIWQYQLGARVRITGWISSEEVQKQLIEARALVLPSFAEGLPVVIMEAMALRRPVISTYVAGIPELVHDGEHGWLVPAGDVGALLAAINRCLETPSDVLQRMADAAYEQAARLHNVDTESAKLIALIRGSVQINA